MEVLPPVKLLSPAAALHHLLHQLSKDGSWKASLRLAATFGSVAVVTSFVQAAVVSTSGKIACKLQ